MGATHVRVAMGREPAREPSPWRSVVEGSLLATKCSQCPGLLRGHGSCRSSRSGESRRGVAIVLRDDETKIPCTSSAESGVDASIPDMAIWFLVAILVVIELISQL
jgi:hypothetical protein